MAPDDPLKGGLPTGDRGLVHRPGPLHLRHLLGFPQQASVPPMPHHALGLPLELPHPLARDAQFVTEFGKRGRLPFKP